MASYNRVVLVGNLTRDPEYRQLPSGQAVCRLGLATNRQFKSRQTGESVQEVCYIDVDVWGAQAESCNQYLSKGRGVLVEGRIKFDTWEDQNGQSRSKHSVVADRVVFLASGSAVAGTDEMGTTRAEAASAPAAAPVKTDTPAAQAIQSELEKEIAGKVAAVQQRAAAKKTAAVAEAASTADADAQQKATAPAGEVAFKDQPPFEDDLPF